MRQTCDKRRPPRLINLDGEPRGRRLAWISTEPESPNRGTAKGFIELRFARSCYDHLAGQVEVAVTDALMAMGHIVLTDEGGEVTSSGGRFFSAFGADLRELVPVV